ncbi:MAG: gliding motility-associated C-terminal domain-containing protein [Bacteroidales bacterium]|nr:gliding motility-associated C-terminal domain-containing protein [Bacteroidales bacterium]
MFFTLLCCSVFSLAFSQGQESGYLHGPSGDMPSGTVATDSSVVVSSYFNANDPRDEWTELLVVADNIDMRNWKMQDNNAAQGAFQPAITFNNISFWNNMRAGTIIMIWHRMVGTNGVTHPTASNKATGYIEVSANDVAWFNGGSFGTAPSFAGATLNVAAGGDLIQLLTGPGVFVHALGHQLNFGSSWTPLPLPKLNHKASLVNNEAVFVCPGKKVDEYGHLIPQDGTTWTAKSATDLSFGLPNCTSTSSGNSDYWRLVRQPRWVSPVLTGTVNGANTQVTLNWNAAVDPFPGDGTQGYLILRNNVNTFGTPLDGHTYAVGENIGGASVIAIIPSSQTLTYDDLTTVPCAGGLFYRIYTFRYIADALGNDYNLARGRAYNEMNFGAVQVLYPAPVAPVSAASDRDNFCADDPGDITLSATGGSGNTLNWYSESCGGTLIGPGVGVTNSITIPSPAVTTTYYARWEDACGVSTCTEVTVTVLPNVPVSVVITASINPVCEGTAVTFTATPVNPGLAPGYQWTVNGINMGPNNPVYTFVPVNGDDVACILTSNAACAAGSPATSNNITMTVTPANIVSITIAVSENPVCTGTLVTFTATPINPGASPGYQWTVNGVNAGTNSPIYTYVPVDGDDVACILTSNVLCASGSPATSNNIVMSVSSAIPVTITIVASENPVCIGTMVTFDATPVNPGTSPGYQWKVNGANVGTSLPSYAYIPVNSDDIICVLTSNASCASGSPATSNSIIMSVSSSIPVGIIIAASENPVCTGTPVTFTATPANPGPSPGYQWKVNGANAGTNSPDYTYTPANGDIVTCVLTSNASCASGSPAISNSITMSVGSAIPVTITIAASQNPVCIGTMVTFTATPANPGTSPGYQWKVNGANVGTNFPTYAFVPVNGDNVTCLLTSNASCVSGNPATSNSIIMAISSAIPLSVSLAASPGISVCQGTVVTYTATPVNGGSSPSFQWYFNSNPAGGNTSSWSNTPANGDKIFCVVTSNSSCATNNPASSDTIAITITSSLVSSVTVTANHDKICPGTSVTFTATSVNGGSFSVHEWLVNGVQAQQGISPVFITNTILPGDQVICRLSSSLPCVAQQTVSSLPVVLSAAPIPEVILSNQPFLCTGISTPLDAGANFSSYTWQDGSNGRYMNILDEGIYWVIVNDTLGCTASDSVLVKKCSGNIYVPNAFSPNGDGLNDVFRIFANPDDIAEFSMQVFNRWGAIIYESTNLLQGWDGMKQGTYCPTDSYIWKVNYRSTASGPSGEVLTITGKVELVR